MPTNLQENLGAATMQYQENAALFTMRAASLQTQDMLKFGMSSFEQWNTCAHATQSQHFLQRS
jgi:hypothetical protein